VHQHPNHTFLLWKIANAHTTAPGSTAHQRPNHTFMQLESCKCSHNGFVFHRCWHAYSPPDTPFPGSFLLGTGAEDYPESAYYFNAGPYVCFISFMRAPQRHDSRTPRTCHQMPSRVSNPLCTPFYNHFQSPTSPAPLVHPISRSVDIRSCCFRTLCTHVF
jgi:hypothetical protein